MYILLKKGELNRILSLAYARAGTIYKLVDKVNIPKSTLSAYHTEHRIINRNNFEKLINYLNISKNDIEIIKELPSNWRQIKGGKNCVEIKKKNGTFEEQMKKCRNYSSQSLRIWHKNLKRENPNKYYLMQYSRFKKISNYKFLTKNNELVRNKLELDIANLLKSMNISYKYEPLVKIGKRYFFPDFLINDKIIIECTFWRGFDKAVKLRSKIHYLEKKYLVYVVIPKALNRYYETLNQYLVLGLDNLAAVLQKKSE